MPYQATWFDQNIPYWELCLSRFKDQPVKFLEIGCFEGRATVWLLKNILTHPESRITALDTFEGSPEFPRYNIDNSLIEANFYKNIKKYKNKVDVIKEKSEVLKQGV